MNVSIVVTSFNYGRYIERCIESCLTQTLARDEFEVIVVDDASTDDTRDILEPYRRSQDIMLLQRSQNMGVADSANMGIRYASGEFVVRVDADDYVQPQFAERLREAFLGRPDLLGVACNYRDVDDQGELIGYRSARLHPISCGIMYNRAYWVSLGLYNPEWRDREEEELRKRLGSAYKIAYLESSLYNFVQHDTRPGIALDHPLHYATPTEQAHASL